MLQALALDGNLEVFEAILGQLNVVRDLSERHWEVDHDQKWLFWSQMKAGCMTHLLC